MQCQQCGRCGGAAGLVGWSGDLGRTEGQVVQSLEVCQGTGRAVVGSGRAVPSAQAGGDR